MKRQITKVFDEYISQIFFSNENVKNMLTNHERKESCIVNICEQIKIAEMSNIRGSFNTKKYRILIHEVAKMFCSAVLKMEETKALSQIEKQRRIDESTRINQIEEEFDEMQKEAEDDKIISYPTV